MAAYAAVRIAAIIRYGSTRTRSSGQDFCRVDHAIASRVCEDSNDSRGYGTGATSIDFDSAAAAFIDYKSASATRIDCESGTAAISIEYECTAAAR